MRQLTALDAQFLHAESPTTALHVAGLAIIEPAPAGTVTRDDLVALLRRRIHRAPALRLRLADVPFGLDRPYWTDVPGFDPADHVHEVTLSSPDRLHEEVGRLHARHLDRTRPLWEAHLIHGLAGGRVALYTKVHHCAIDGVSGAETLRALLDPSPDPAPDPEPGEAVAITAPDPVAMLAGAAARSATYPVRAFGSLSRTVTDLDVIPVAASLPGARRMAQAARALLGDSRPMPDLPELDVPRTMINGPITGERSFAYGSLPLEQIRQVGRAFGMSTNDVVMALCAAALRAFLDKRGGLPDRPLIAAVPVAVRSQKSDLVGNRLSAMVAPLPTDVACPRRRVEATRDIMAAAKRRFARNPATWLSELSSLLPSALAAATTASAFRFASVACPPINLIISNVPGPRHPLYLCGARMESWHPISALTDVSGALTVTCFNYAETLDFGVIACPELVDDVWEFWDHLESALAEMLDLGAESDLDDGAPGRL